MRRYELCYMFVCRNRYGTVCNRTEMKTTVCQLPQRHSTQLYLSWLSRRLMFTPSVKCVRMELIHSMNAFPYRLSLFIVDTKTVYCLNSIDVYLVYLYVLKLWHTFNSSVDCSYSAWKCTINTYNVFSENGHFWPVIFEMMKHSNNPTTNLFWFLLYLMCVFLFFFSFFHLCLW